LLAGAVKLNFSDCLRTERRATFSPNVFATARSSMTNGRARGQGSRLASSARPTMLRRRKHNYQCIECNTMRRGNAKTTAPALRTTISRELQKPLQRPE
jgi:hypothetical protein